MLNGLTLRIKGHSNVKTILLEKQLYNSLLTILNDPKYYYQSCVGAQYNHFYDVGKEQLIEWIELLAPKMLELQRKADEERAKDMVWKKVQDE